MHTVSYVSLFHCFVASFRFVVSSLLFRLEQWSCRCPTWPTQGQRLQRQLLQNLLPCIVPPYERIREKKDRSRLIVWQKLCALVSVHTARASLSQSSATDCANGLALRVPRRVASSSWSAKAPAFVKKMANFFCHVCHFFAPAVPGSQKWEHSSLPFYTILDLHSHIFKAIFHWCVDSFFASNLKGEAFICIYLQAASGCWLQICANFRPTFPSLTEMIHDHDWFGMGWNH